MQNLQKYHTIIRLSLKFCGHHINELHKNKRPFKEFEFCYSEDII